MIESDVPRTRVFDRGYTTERQTPARFADSSHGGQGWELYSGLFPRPYKSQPVGPREVVHHKPDSPGTPETKFLKCCSLWFYSCRDTGTKSVPPLPMSRIHVCLCVRVSVHVCVCTCVCVSMSVYVYSYVCLCVSVGVYMCVRVCTSLWICVSLCVSMCPCVCPCRCTNSFCCRFGGWYCL